MDYMLDFPLVQTVINTTVRVFFELFDYVVLLVTRVVSSLEPKQKVPPIKSDVLHLSAKQLAERIRNKELKSLDLIETYIDRIKEVQPYINSVVEDRFEDALNEAKIVDDLLLVQTDLEDMPLLGVPLSVKETIAVRGMSNNAARSRVESRVAEKDATVVSRLRAAGAIPMVVTNTPELCLYWETYSHKFGRTNNPYDTRRTVAGSSGGEVSLIASGGSVIGIASDIAGSLRFTALFCGIYGHKPTPGYVPNDGHVPTSKDPKWDYYFTLGPLTRYAEDLPLMMKVLVGKDNVDKLKLNVPVDISKVKIYYMYGEGSESILQRVPGVEVIRAMELAVASLRDKLGCQVEEVRCMEFLNSVYLNTLILQMKGVENIFQPDDEHPDDWGIFQILKAVTKKLACMSTASISCILYGPMKYFVDRMPESLNKMLNKKADSIKTKVFELLKDDGVLLYPTFPEEAPLHNRLCSRVLEVSYCSIFNVLGMPVTQCPITQTKDGLPIGLQIAAAPHNDRLCLEVARALEKELGGWVPPSP